ncbi:MAG: phosphoenolpyruvate carboxylase [Halanaeroarchaeum sp.]
MSNHSRDIQADIEALTGTLASVLDRHDERWALETKTDVVETAAAHRSGAADSRASLFDRMARLSTGEMTSLARVITTDFELTNLAEERQRVREIERRRDEGALSEDLSDSLADLVDDPDVSTQRVLADVHVQPTFTAHPTEARRKTVKSKLRAVADALAALEDADTDRHRRRVRRRLEATVESLWQTPRLRDHRPDPIDEARNVHWYLRRTLFDTIGTVYDEVERSLVAADADDVSVPQLISFRSWAGSDRDGNPHVTPAVTERTLARQRSIAIEEYRDRLDDLVTVLSHSRDHLSVSDRLEQSLASDRDRFPALAETLAERYDGEPYRKKVLYVRERLDRIGDVRPGAYDGPDGLLADLDLLLESLRENDAHAVAETHVEPLRRRVETFGFVLAALDLRDHRENHTEAVGELLDRVGIDYRSLDEDERQSVLTEAIRRDGSIVDPSDTAPYGETTTRVATRFDRLRDWQAEYGRDAVDTYCISMTEEPSHVLEVLFLADQAGVVSLPDHGGLSIVPLLETESALSGARRIMETLFENDAYADLLAAGDRTQEVMLGYSDSNKENGFLAANWSLYTDQRRLAAIAEDHDVTLRLFHGRGGSISRGGGPMNEALRALPTETVTGEVKFTEQGEAIAEKYANPAIAERNIEQMLDAQIRARREALTVEREHVPAAHESAMETMAEAAREEYRDLLETPGFVEYFSAVTPIGVIEDLNLGSRPASRSGDRTVEDLRAIPWVFSWTQSRWIVPGWYGLGTGIEAALEGGDVETLREMYETWPFFETTIDNASLALARSEPEIAAAYADLAPEDLRERFAPRLSAEYDRSVAAVSAITGRDRLVQRDWLAESLERRNPAVDPLNAMQVALLDRDDRTDAESRVLRLTVKGIAAGMKNTG